MEDPIAEEIINASLKQGDTLMVDYDKEADKIVMKVEKPKAPKENKNKEPKVDPPAPPAE